MLEFQIGTDSTQEGYGLLASSTRPLGLCLFRVKPKLHLQEHFASLCNA